MKYKKQEKYEKANVIRMSLKINKKTEKDIYEAIDLNNKQGSIKRLIRQGITKEE